MRCLMLFVELVKMLAPLELLLQHEKHQRCNMISVQLIFTLIVEVC